MSDITVEAAAIGRPGLLQSILLPLGAGYFLSYFFRNVNGMIGGDLLRETGAGAGVLGLLTGIYFVAFTVSQMPLGRALDRFGPRRVQTLLLTCAALGAMIFAAADNAAWLAIGRFLIGLGTAGCLTAGLKATMQWSARWPGAAANLSTVNGLFVMFGGLGAMAATVPMARLVAALGWRATFEILGAGAALLAVLTFLTVPDGDAPGRRPGPMRPPTTASAGGQPVGRLPVGRLPADRLLWAFLPMSALTFGSVSALQGLWASRWFADVRHFSADGVADHLLVMAAALTAGAPLLGFIAGRLGKRIGTGRLAIWTALALVAIEALICMQAPLPDLLLWPALALAGAIPVLSYGVLAELYPVQSIGRANAILNMGHTGTAFAAQYGIGAVVGLFPARLGVYPLPAYQAAIGVLMLCQLAAIIFFAWYRPRFARRDRTNQPA
jgi:MFS family permease